MNDTAQQSKFSVGTGPATKATTTARDEEEVMKRLHYECVAKFLIALRLTAIEALDRQTVIRRRSRDRQSEPKSEPRPSLFVQTNDKVSAQVLLCRFRSCIGILRIDRRIRHHTTGATWVRDPLISHAIFGS